MKQEQLKTYLQFLTFPLIYTMITLSGFKDGNMFAVSIGLVVIYGFMMYGKLTIINDEIKNNFGGMDETTDGLVRGSYQISKETPSALGWFMILNLICMVTFAYHKLWFHFVLLCVVVVMQTTALRLVTSNVIILDGHITITTPPSKEEDN